MKTKTQKTITLDVIKTALDTRGLSEAMQRLFDSSGAKMEISGMVEKVARREGINRLVIKTSGNGQQMNIIANFNKPVKVKKGAEVSITGHLVSFGLDTVVMDGCKLI